MSRNVRPNAMPTAVSPPGTSASDDGWTAELWAACGCSALLLGLLLLIGVGSGRLTGLRALMWVALAVLLLVVLVPPRVTTGEGWLASRSCLFSLKFPRHSVRKDGQVLTVGLGNVANSE